MRKNKIWKLKFEDTSGCIMASLPDLSCMLIQSQTIWLESR